MSKVQFTPKTEESQDLTSMLYWYPLIKDLPIPQPKTVFVYPTQKELEKMYNETMPDSFTKKIKAECDLMGYPCFVRTDLASGKHNWKRSCFVDGKTELWTHLLEVVEFNLCADIMGLDFKAFAVREYIQMDSKFTAFYGDMPVNPERRYFVKDGKLVCHHPYWIKEAIEQDKTPSVPNWRELSDEMNKESPEEITLLSDYAIQVAKILPSSWSIDFCKAKDGRWILIDLAVANRSWHPQDCPHLVKNKPRLVSNKDKRGRNLCEN